MTKDRNVDDRVRGCSKKLLYSSLARRAPSYLCSRTLPLLQSRRSHSLLTAKARSRARVQDQGHVQAFGDSFIELIICLKRRANHGVFRIRNNLNADLCMELDPDHNNINGRSPITLVSTLAWYSPVGLTAAA
eukprot:scaffold16542_cov152-Skeletonema_dohrnii-CCMP3373.AAC.7